MWLLPIIVVLTLPSKIDGQNLTNETVPLNANCTVPVLPGVSHWKTSRRANASSGEVLPIGAEIEPVCEHRYFANLPLIKASCLESGMWSNSNLSQFECVNGTKASTSSASLELETTTRAIQLSSLTVGDTSTYVSSSKNDSSMNDTKLGTSEPKSNTSGLTNYESSTNAPRTSGPMTTAAATNLSTTTIISITSESLVNESKSVTPITNTSITNKSTTIVPITGVPTVNESATTTPINSGQTTMSEKESGTQSSIGNTTGAPSTDAETTDTPSTIGNTTTGGAPSTDAETMGTPSTIEKTTGAPSTIRETTGASSRIVTTKIPLKTSSKPASEIQTSKLKGNPTTTVIDDGEIQGHLALTIVGSLVLGILSLGVIMVSIMKIRGRNKPPIDLTLSRADHEAMMRKKRDPHDFLPRPPPLPSEINEQEFDAIPQVMPEEKACKDDEKPSKTDKQHKKTMSEEKAYKDDENPSKKNKQRKKTKDKSEVDSRKDSSSISEERVPSKKKKQKDEAAKQKKRLELLALDDMMHDM